MYKPLLSIVLALACLLLVSTAARAESPAGEEWRLHLLERNTVPTPPAVSLAYGQIMSGAPVYARLGDAGPSDWLAPGFVFVSLVTAYPVAFGGGLWYPLYEGGFVPARYVLPYAPSTFQGLQLGEQPDRPFAWVLWDSALSAGPGARAAPTAPHLTRYSLVTLLQEQDVDGVAWYRVGDAEWISQYRLAVVAAATRPPAIGPTDKWIEVNLYEQTLAAYEGDRMVYATLVSSGLPKWETTPGLFHIYDKVRQERMTGEEGQPDYYYLQDIPWIMYFDNDQALHTAYWHDGFGSPHSHGCVNLAPQDALWLYNWTTPSAGPNNHTRASEEEPGTWVWVHN